MSADDPVGATGRTQTRVPIDAEVQLEFENFSGFIREVSANLSLGGMFVKTRYLKPVGTIVRFEFRLSDQYRLIRGTGEVVWTRWRDQPPAMPAGMGIQFLDLDAESRTLVSAIVEQHERAGGAPFDLVTQGDLEAAVPPPSPRSPLAEGLPPASGAGVTSEAVSQWLRAGDEPAVAEPEAEALPPVEDDETIFTPPDFDLPVPPPAEAPEWSFDAPRPSAPARPLDWGAAEAMAALGIAPANAAAAPSESSAPFIPPAPSPLPPAPRFTGSRGAHAEDTGGRKGLWVVAIVTVAGLAGGGWWLYRTQPRSRPAPPAPASSPASAAGAPTGTPPAPAMAAPGPVAVAPPPAAGASRQAASAPVPTAAAPIPAASPAPTPPVPAAPAPTAAASRRFTAVERITWQAAGGETVVVIATDGAVTPADVQHLRLEQPEPREVVKVLGVSRSSVAARLQASTPELRQIRVGLHGEGSRGELHVVLDLSSPGVRILAVEAQGSTVRVHLGRS